ncbi:MFS transporter [Jeotgalibacillus proteolyticus]|uniref:MFS transporter n=1 Tax=Jeotgalibacillus proteolyticus TaxID=2082395 RepID=UPI003CF1030B
MNLTSTKDYLTYWTILLMGIGISNIGAWVYLLSLNLLLFNRTGSPFSVIFLYLLAPVAALFTNGWSGSVIDRKNKRKLMIFLDLMRALMVCTFPFISSLWLLYSLAFLMNVANAVFKPASMVYVTKLIPGEKRRHFNSLYSMVTSGAFLLGPALAGLLYLHYSSETILFITAAAFALSAAATLFMPDIEAGGLSTVTASFKLRLRETHEDWRKVRLFSKKSPSVMIIYLLISWVMVVMATAVDSLEVVFSKNVLELTNSEYGFLVSIAGAGIVAGSFIQLLLVKWIPLFSLIRWAPLFISGGYMLFGFSDGFVPAAAGFFILAFFISFGSTGFLTFYQSYIPVEMMGRIGSIYGLFEAALVLAATGVLGLLTFLLPVKLVVITGTISMMIGALFLWEYVRKKCSSLAPVS